MKRRDFIKNCAIGGAAAMTAAGLGGMPLAPGSAQADIFVGVPPEPMWPVTDKMDFIIEPALKELADSTLCNVWAIRAKDKAGNVVLQVPGPQIVVVEGTEITCTVENLNTIPHRLQIPGVFDTGLIQPSQKVTVKFNAPEGGSYMYYDPENAPMNRVMGLHGAFISLPAVDNGTPYSNPTPVIQKLFSDLGTSYDIGIEETPLIGNPWSRTRSWVWLFSTYDPSKNLLAQDAAANGQILDPAVFTDTYYPRYYEISGKSGYWSATDPDISPWGNCGMPALIRCMSAGMAAFSPHIHGNHVYQLSDNGLWSNLRWIDTWTMEPLHVKDMLHPFMIPPDINKWPPSPNSDSNEAYSQFPLVYPMHCHLELSQTAAGGNYPFGALLHWTLLTPVIGGPVTVDTNRADNPLVHFEPDERVFIV